MTKTFLSFFSLPIFSAFLLLLLSISPTFAKSEDNNKTIKLATTTSTENSGLLKAILPEFEKDSGYKVHTIAVGTGKALRMGRDGDVDALLVHAKKAEQEFMAEGHGEECERQCHPNHGAKDRR